MVDKFFTAETFQMAQVVNKTGDKGPLKKKNKTLVTGLLFIWLAMNVESFIWSGSNLLFLLLQDT